MKSQISAIGLSLLTAFASSLCCIVPFIALLAGTSSIAANLSWIEPAQPYLYGISILALGFAWYQKLKPIPADDCGCEVGSSSFFQSKKFLGIVTAFALFMMAFPYISGSIMPSTSATSPAVVVADENIVPVEFEVQGMTCGGCERHVSDAVTKLEGIIEVSASFENKNTIVKFDKTKTTIEEIQKAIAGTGYKVKEKINKSPQPLAPAGRQ